MGKQKAHIRQARVFEMMGLEPNMFSCPYQRGYYTRSKDVYLKMHSVDKAARVDIGHRKIMALMKRVTG